MNILQLKASDPNLSTWVSASAGSGKTKILTDRVLRLLIGDVPFNKILCLTFTNAAAGEMHERIIRNLEKWSKLSGHELKESLKKTIGYDVAENKLKKAAALFGLYLKTQDQINIYTIHSFCQKILKKFPLEAGISPNFKIIDEISVYQIIKKLKKQILSSPDNKLMTRFLAENFHEITINEILNDIVSVQRKFLNSNEHNIINNEALNNYVNSNKQESRSLSLKTLMHDHNLSKICDNKDIPLIIQLLDNEDLQSFFLTADGKKKKRIVTKNIAPADSNLYKALELIQEIVYIHDQEKKTKTLLEYSSILSLIAKTIITEFDKYKKHNALLDYDDLITYTQNLLTNSHAKEWVLYKLDGGIDHLLVDEAQDTSKSQWQIIEALIEEFYSGESKNREDRTIFVVGDEKQSIFSFQGADIDSFGYMNQFLHKKLNEAKKPFETINLDISYRSTHEILKVVTDVFSKIIKNNPSDFNANLPEMKAHRNNHTGSVELWPLCKNKDDKKDSALWPINETTHQDSKTILAKKIAHYVSAQINSGRILSSTNKKISQEDFMILFRTRDEFTDQVITALDDIGVLTTGLDRIALKEDLGVIDLLSIAKFVINPKNDLNLAALLKSPIFRISEQLLYELCAERKSTESLIERIPDDDYATKLNQFINLYKNLPLGDFFLYITDVLNYRDLITHNPEAIDEFLKLSKNYFAQHDGGMQNFIYWFEENQISIKRDSDTKNKLRIMTTHAAKGLQAPIVILCDTTKLPHLSDRFLWDEDDKMYFAKSASNAPLFYEELKKIAKQKAYQEYLRLLYVGMTRAEDHLIICGYQGSNSIPENCWYSLLKNSMEVDSAAEDEQIDLFPSCIVKNNAITTLESLHAFSTLMPSISEASSRLNENLLIENSYSYIPKNLSTQYGIVFHKILEDVIGTKNINNLMMHPMVKTLDEQSQKRITTNLQKLINNDRFTNLLKNDVKTEVSFGYMDGDDIKIGRVDLLVIEKNRIRVIDYKSDLYPPQDLESIPKSYIRQLWFYKKAFENIYPDKIIECEILWLENGCFNNVT